MNTKWYGIVGVAVLALTLSSTQFARAEALGIRTRHDFGAPKGYAEKDFTQRPGASGICGSVRDRRR